MTASNTIEIERKIARKLVSDALASGYTVSVYDGEEWALKRADKLGTIVDAMFSTDSDTLRFRDAAGEAIGSVLLIHGNGPDVISDHTDNAAIGELVKGASAMADREQARWRP